MFSDTDRHVFAYKVDGVNLFADPLEIEHSLCEALDGDPNSVLADACGEDVCLRQQAQKKLADATRHAFYLPPFKRATGEGITRQQALDLLDSFLEWMDSQKKTSSSGPSPTLPPPSGVESSPG